MIENIFRNYQVYTIHINQEFPGRYDLGIKYILVPRLFLRPLADPPNQTINYSDAEIEIQSFKLDFDRSFSKWLEGVVSGLFEQNRVTIGMMYEF